METELAEALFRKIANYRKQALKIEITNTMRVGVLSIFWRTLLTSLNRSNDRTEEDKVAVLGFLASAKKQIRQKIVTSPIYIVPFHGNPPFYGLPVSMTYLLDRMVGAPDIRFFDNPHRYYAVFKLPFMFFYIPSEGWGQKIYPDGKFSGLLKMSEIRRMPTFLRDYVFWLAEQFEMSKRSMSPASLDRIVRDVSKSKDTTGSHKSMARSRVDKSQTPVSWPMIGE
ncbi:hypothetical protein BDI4_700073 [Burkholderia diffusa]|nr:hypothetical protein BDI4_700073 [Burkholderia diffusa]